MRGVKNPSLIALLLLAVVPGCSREDAHTSAKPAAAAARPGLATVAPKPEPIPAGKRRVLELEGGVRVEVIAEGEGEIVGPGDEVALSMTLTYMPKSPEELKAEAAQAEAAAKEAEKKDAEKQDTAKKDADKKHTGTKDEKKKSKPAQDEPAKTESKPAEPAAVDGASAAKPAAEGAKPLPPLISESAVSAAPGAKAETTSAPEHGAKPEAATETKPQTEPAAQTEPASPPAADGALAAADSKPSADAAAQPATDATTTAEGTAPAPAPLAAALEPVVVVSTKASGTPIRARVGASGALVPGLSRALVGLRQGTVAEITLPAESAYGAAGLPSAGIPPGTPLHATIEIREVKR